MGKLDLGISVEKLTCPGCGTTYPSYRGFFKCWTGHLDAKVGNAKSSELAPALHDDAVIFYRENPERIEKGLRIIASEVGVFHGRMDLIAVDSKKRLVIIDVDNGHDPDRKVKQLKRYKKSVEWIGTRIYGLRLADMPCIRLLMVNPNKYVKEV